MAFNVKIKIKRKLLIVAAEKPKILQATSSQFITGFDRICSLRLKVLFEIFKPLEQPFGPDRILFSIPICQIE